MAEKRLQLLRELQVTTSKGGAWVRHVGWVVTIATPAVFTAVLRGGGVCFDEAQRWAWTMVRYVYFHVCVRVYGQFD